jgi:hypothetical protein
MTEESPDSEKKEQSLMPAIALILLFIAAGIAARIYDHYLPHCPQCGAVRPR